MSLVLVVGTISGCGKLAASPLGQFVMANKLAVAAGTVVVGALALSSSGGGSAVTTTTTTTSSTTTTGGGGTTTTTTTTSTTTTTMNHSISGTVNFATTSDGIKGGAVISLTSAETVVATTAADVDDGTYAFSSVAAGSYDLSASKEGWTIPSITVEILSEDQANSDFAANPTGWTIQIVDSETWETATSLEGKVYVAGTGPVVWKSIDEGSSWEVAITDSNSAESIVKMFAGGGRIIYW